MATSELIKEIYLAFGGIDRPEQGVDEPAHCLTCEETHDTYNRLTSRSSLTVNDFNICYISTESLSTNALHYLMPRLLELAIIGEENEWESFLPQAISSLYPNTFGDRLIGYNDTQSRSIVMFIAFMLEKYKTLGNEVENIELCEYEQRCYKNAEKAQQYWLSRR